MPTTTPAVAPRIAHVGPGFGGPVIPATGIFFVEDWEGCKLGKPILGTQHIAHNVIGTWSHRESGEVGPEGGSVRNAQETGTQFREPVWEQSSVFLDLEKQSEEVFRCVKTLVSKYQYYREVPS